MSEALYGAQTEDGERREDRTEGKTDENWGFGGEGEIICTTPVNLDVNIRFG
jgi:hypothetical protein